VTRTLLCVLVLLAGCVHLSQPAPRIQDYRLDYTPPVPAGTPLPVTVRVAPLRVAAVYDREAIVYRDDAYSTGRYFYHRWSSNPGDMIADLLARDLAASQRYRAVEQGLPSVPADYVLSGELEEIEERRTPAGCTANLRLRMLVVPNRSDTAAPLLQATYTADEPCPCNEPHALVEAMSRGLEDASAKLQQNAYDVIASDRRRP